MPGATLVRDVMTREVVTLRPDHTIEEAADVLAEHRIGAAPVVEPDGRLVGLLTDEDLIVSEARLHVPTTIAILGGTLTLPGSMRHFEEDLKKAVGATVRDVMDSEYPTVSPDDTVETLATLMHDRNVSHVPVVDAQGRLVGIVARGDLVRLLSVTT
ncbi:MAG: CBS domain-containing protein [Acidimicrobiia bacterium]|nr:CBS domain-containing protein [Acidimicrobiia bacterium]